MGTVHKFKRPPKNQQQFRGYRPQPQRNTGGGTPARRRLRSWQKSLFVWAALVLLAAGIWAVGALIGKA